LVALTLMNSRPNHTPLSERCGLNQAYASMSRGIASLTYSMSRSLGADGQRTVIVVPIAVGTGVLVWMILGSLLIWSTLNAM
jgi:hypothetical protein